MILSVYVFDSINLSGCLHWSSEQYLAGCCMKEGLHELKGQVYRHGGKGACPKSHQSLHAPPVVDSLLGQGRQGRHGPPKVHRNPLYPSFCLFPAYGNTVETKPDAVCDLETRKSTEPEIISCDSP